MSIYASLDVSDMTPHVCVVDAEGAVLRWEVLASTRSSWLSDSGRYCRDLKRVGDCRNFRVRSGIMGKKESHYVSTQRARDTERVA